MTTFVVTLLSLIIGGLTAIVFWKWAGWRFWVSALIGLAVGTGFWLLLFFLVLPGITKCDYKACKATPPVPTEVVVVPTQTPWIIIQTQEVPASLTPTNTPTHAPTPTSACTVTTTSNDTTLVMAAIKKLNLPYVAGKPYPVVTPKDLLAYFSITGVDPTSLVVDSDCTTVQLEPVPSGNGFASVNACNPTNRRFDGWRSALQAGGITLTDQQGFPTGQSSVEGISWAPMSDNSPILAIPGVCQ